MARVWDTRIKQETIVIKKSQQIPVIKTIPATTNGTHQFKMTIRSVKLENLPQLLSRDNDFLADIERTIKKCPPNEARFIPASPNVIDNLKQRHNFQFKVQHAIKALPGRWLFRWFGYKKIFLLIREENLKAYMANFKLPREKTS